MCFFIIQLCYLMVHLLIIGFLYVSHCLYKSKMRIKLLPLSTSSSHGHRYLLNQHLFTFWEICACQTILKLIFNLWEISDIKTCSILHQFVAGSLITHMKTRLLLSLPLILYDPLLLVDILWTIIAVERNLLHLIFFTP